MQVLDDAFTYGRGCCCSACGYDRSFRQLFDECGDAEIIRPEILAPLEYAVGLVNRHQADSEGLCEAKELGGDKTLRSDVEQAYMPLSGRLIGHGTFGTGGLRIDECGGDSVR